MAWLIAICIAVSIASSLILVPVIREIALWMGVVDRPDSERKLHTRPVALGGGLAVFCSLAISFVATILLDRAWFGGELGYVSSRFYTLFGAAGSLLIVGLIDDAWVLRGRQKLLLQCLVLFALVGGGTLIKQVNVLGFNVDLGILAFPVTVIWLLLAINALNLIDGADGMATTAGGVISGGLGIIALYNGSSMSALIAFSLAASLVGFLAFNRPPASIYLGDAGSMTIGLFVGVLAVWSSVKESTILASAPVAILAIPLFDSSAAIVRRWLTGRSMYTTDRAHLHHLLLEKHGPVRMLLVVAGLCIITTSLAVMSVVWNRPWLAVLGVGLVITVLVLTRSFGHAEAKLLAGRAVHFIRSFAAHPVDSESETHHRRVALQGEERWDTVWEPLVAFAKGHGLSQVKIDLNLAWLHEGYHANWQSVRMPEKPLQLQISLPLFANRFADLSRVPIGRLEVISAANDPGVHERIAALSDLLADLAVEINRIVERLERDKRKNRRDQRDPQLEEPVRANARREDVSAIPVESTQVTGAPSTAYSST